MTQLENGRAEDWLLELAQRHRLSPTQRQIVQRMLGMFPAVAFLSSVEIAEQTGVSQPTVTRLATALGFAGFPEFRVAMRDAVAARDQQRTQQRLEAHEALVDRWIH
ncbi:MAG TPA: hypothetical protein VN408_41900 [Actinoplanes sp.]|nr:hypothetical protein [Actinoplanes sp.]